MFSHKYFAPVSESGTLVYMFPLFNSTCTLKFRNLRVEPLDSVI